MAIDQTEGKPEAIGAIALINPLGAAPDDAVLPRLHSFIAARAPAAHRRSDVPILGQRLRRVNARTGKEHGCNDAEK